MEVAPMLETTNNWASAPEWSGWTVEWNYSKTGVVSVHRRLMRDIDAVISSEGGLTIDKHGRDTEWWEPDREMEFKSPAIALQIANTIAEALGGWPDETP